jgi:hypothetical protein
MLLCEFALGVVLDQALPTLLRLLKPCGELSVRKRVMFRTVAVAQGSSSEMFRKGVRPPRQVPWDVPAFPGHVSCTFKNNLCIGEV